MTECSHCDAHVNLCADGVVKLVIMMHECWNAKVVKVWCDMACRDAEVAGDG